MGLLAGILRIQDTTLITTLPARQVSDAVNQLLARYEEERRDWFNLFVQDETTEYKVLYNLGAVDEGQEIGTDGRPLETRVTGQIDVAFPMRRIGWATGWNYETAAYMTLEDLEKLTAARQGGNAKRHLREIFRALFNSANYTYTDPIHGPLTIRRLANTDGTIFPPTWSSDTEADDNHYLVSGYAPTAISATNNPFVTLKAELIEHFTVNTQVVAIINAAQRTEILTDLPSFVDAPTAGITPGDQTAIANALGGINVPGTFLGIDNDSGVYVYVNDTGRVPANYILALAVGAPAPLRRRIPVPESLQGFKLEAEEESYPMFKRTFVERFGYGVANRLGAAVMFLDSGGSYTTPAAYA